MTTGRSLLSVLRPTFHFGFSLSIKLIEHFCEAEPNRCAPAGIRMLFLKLRFYRCLSIKYEIKLNRRKATKNGFRWRLATEVRHSLSLFFMDYSNHFLRLRSTGGTSRTMNAETIEQTSQLILSHRKNAKYFRHRKRIYFDLSSQPRIALTQTTHGWIVSRAFVFYFSCVPDERGAKASVKFESKKINLKIKNYRL